MVKKLSLLLVVASIPTLAWSYVKPCRFILPHLNGVQCNGSVCVEDHNDMEQAIELYNSAITNVSASGITLKAKPKFVYCSTTECYQSFGGGNERAISYPFLGTVIAPESWQIYITQHELVHWFQFFEFGSFSTMRKPEWFREGMAYMYSGAPASDIPEHYLAMMQKYRKWHSEKSWLEVIHQARQL